MNPMGYPVRVSVEQGWLLQVVILIVTVWYMRITFLMAVMGVQDSRKILSRL